MRLNILIEACHHGKCRFSVYSLLEFSCCSAWNYHSSCFFSPCIKIDRQRRDPASVHGHVGSLFTAPQTLFRIVYALLVQRPDAPLPHPVLIPSALKCPCLQTSEWRLFCLYICTASGRTSLTIFPKQCCKKGITLTYNF